ncbi:unnamed protein product [Chironomus riparius]|uniref:BZIP domain-containing protein n=1 Tax=Chironomus riparius TaxID=315576 RepID=A0A9N9RST7_9DIPT|nr:unnamed protein product [Chironomus riparius]
MSVNTNSLNALPSLDVKSIQEYIKTFNEEDIILNSQELINNNTICNNPTNNALTSFLSTFVSNDLNEELISYPKSIVSGFNPFVNPLDVEDIYVFQPNEQISDIDDFGYILNTENVSYYDLDSSQSDILSFDGTDLINLDDLCRTPITIINEPKEIVQIIKTIKKEQKSRRGRGRPKTEITKLDEKVADAEKTNDKHVIRIKKNNKASKEYRDRKADKKKQLDTDLSNHTDKYLKLKKTHTKLSLRIEQLEKLLKMHSF